MSTPRPSLNALRAFEATARLRSMTAAANELSVTHGAISHHIRTLEDLFNVPLLSRGPTSTDPSPEGAQLAEGLAAAFSMIQASIEQLKPGPLTLSCSASILMYWLLPRLARFHDTHPGVELQFNVNYGQVDLVRDKISIAIRSTRVEPPPDVVLRELTVEAIGPVCSPEFLRTARIRKPTDLGRVRLLATKTRPDAWAEWIVAAGAAARGVPELVAHDRFEHFYLLIQAAACGLGVAAVPRMLVLDDLRSGKLVAPFGFVPGPHKLALWLAPHVISRPEIRALTRWITAEMRETEGES